VRRSARERVIHSIRLWKAGMPAGCSIRLQTSRPARQVEVLPVQSTLEIFDELRRASARSASLYYGPHLRRIDKGMGCSGPPIIRSPRTPRLFEGGISMHPYWQVQFLLTPWRESGDPVDTTSRSI